MLKFNPFDDSEPHSGLYPRLNVDEQGELGRHVDDNTMAWWSRQKKEIQDEAFGDHERTSVMEAIKQINKFSVGIDEFWWSMIPF